MPLKYIVLLTDPMTSVARSLFAAYPHFYSNKRQVAYRTGYFQLYPFVKTMLCFFAFALLCNQSLFAQQKNNNLHTFQHGTRIQGMPAGINMYFAPQAKQQARLAGVPPCNNSTFYLHLAAANGEKIQLAKLQTFPDGNYLAAGTITATNGTTEGLLVVFSNDGTIITQARLRVNNKPVNISAARISPAGNLYIAGLFTDGTPAVFVAGFSNTLTPIFATTVSETATPVKVTLDFATDASLALAAEISGSVYYNTLDFNGNLQWSKQLTLSSLTGLVGFSMVSGGKLDIVTNCIYNGKRSVQVSDINPADGSLQSTNIQGNGNYEMSCLATTAFGNRLKALGVTQNASAGFDGIRNSFYSSASSEVSHAYQVPFTLDFSATASMDNSGDALGYFLPASGQLAFIKQFSEYQTAPEFCRLYAVPNAGSIAGIARSYDGGFLFGMNTKTSNEIILLKTDSIGNLPGCGSQPATIHFTETFGVANTAVIAAALANPAAQTAAVASTQPAVCTSSFDCKQNYCPPPPPEDSCLSSFHKIYRTGSYVDYVGGLMMMRNDNYIVSSSRSDRIMGTSNIVSHGLKLFDKRGNLLKTMLYKTGPPIQSSAPFQVDDHRFMIASYTGGISGGLGYTFTLMDDNFQQIWSKAIIVGTDFYSLGLGVSDIQMDAEGNFYVAGTRLGFDAVKPAIFVFKLDPNGNTLWTKGYEIANGSHFGTACMTSSPNGLFIVVEAFNNGSISMRLDKNTGQMLNTWSFAVNADGGVWRRFLKYDAGKIFYAGDYKNPNQSSDMLIGLFDTTAKPIMLRRMQNASNGVTRPVSRDGQMRMVYTYYGGGNYKERLLIVDSGLNTILSTEYDNNSFYRLSYGIGLNSAGYVYSVGNYIFGGVNGVYSNPFVIKYGPKGELGTCPYNTVTPVFIDVAPATQTVAASPMAINYPSAPPALLTLVPDNTPLNVSDIPCSAISECSFIDVKDPSPVCKLNNIFAVQYSKDINCTLLPRWEFDTSFAKLESVTDTTALFRFKKAGTVKIKATLYDGCYTYADSTLVEIKPDASSVSLGADTLLCPGDSVVLHAGPGFAQYIWQDGSTDSLFVAKQPGRYFVTTNNSCGDLLSDTINIARAIVPLLPAGPDITACLRDSIPLQAGEGFAQYNWQPGGIIIGQGKMVKAVPNKDTTILLQAITINGCIAKDTVQIHLLSPATIYLGADTSFCQSDSFVLHAGNNFVQYQWNVGSNNESIPVNKSGSYSVAAKDANGCFARDTLVVVQTYKNPAPFLGPDRNICKGDIIVLDAGVFSAWLWQDGSTKQTYTATVPGQYHVLVTDMHHCTGNDSVQIKNVIPLPANFLKTTDTVCKYGTLMIVPQGNYKSYLWSTGNTNTSITIDKPGTYMLSVADYDGCKGKDTITIVEKDCLSGVFIPTAFTPNHDYKNDAFRALVYGPVTKFSLQVYNRFGEQVFSTSNAAVSWDGNYKGKPCNTGNYVWQCTYQFEGMDAVYLKGSVMLLR